MTVEVGDAGAALADLATLARAVGRPDVAEAAEAIRLDSPHALVLVAAEGADLAPLSAWIGRAVPDLAIRPLERVAPVDALGKVALVLPADRLVDAALQDRFAEIARIAPDRAVVATDVGALDTEGLERLAAGLERALADPRVFFFAPDSALDEPTIERSLTDLVGWLRTPNPPEAKRRAALGLRLLERLDVPAEPIATAELSPERLRGLATRVVRQFESEFATAQAAVESGLATLEADVEAVLRHGERGSDDRSTPVDVRVDLWEAKAHDAIVTMLGRTAAYAESLLRDVPWDALEGRAQALGVPGDFRRRLLAALRATDATPVPDLSESVRKGLGETPTTPQAPAAIQAGIGLFGGAIAYFLLGPVVGIGIAVAGVVGVAAGARGSRQAAADLVPVFAAARQGFARNMALTLERIRAQTTAILDEAAALAERPVPAPPSPLDSISALRDRLVRATLPSPQVP